MHALQHESPRSYESQAGYKTFAAEKEEAEWYVNWRMTWVKRPKVVMENDNANKEESTWYANWRTTWAKKARAVTAAPVITDTLSQTHVGDVDVSTEIVRVEQQNPQHNAETAESLEEWFDSLYASHSERLALGGCGLDGVAVVETEQMVGGAPAETLELPDEALGGEGCIEVPAAFRVDPVIALRSVDMDLTEMAGADLAALIQAVKLRSLTNEDIKSLPAVYSKSRPDVQGSGAYRAEMMAGHFELMLRLAAQDSELVCIVAKCQHKMLNLAADRRRHRSASSVTEEGLDDFFQHRVYRDLVRFPDCVLSSVEWTVRKLKERALRDAQVTLILNSTLQRLVNVGMERDKCKNDAKKEKRRHLGVGTRRPWMVAFLLLCALCGGGYTIGEDDRHSSKYGYQYPTFKDARGALESACAWGYASDFGGCGGIMCMAVLWWITWKVSEGFRTDGFEVLRFILTDYEHTREFALVWSRRCCYYPARVINCVRAWLGRSDLIGEETMEWPYRLWEEDWVLECPDSLFVSRSVCWIPRQRLAVHKPLVVWMLFLLFTSVMMPSTVQIARLCGLFFLWRKMGKRTVTGVMVAESCYQMLGWMRATDGYYAVDRRTTNLGYMMCPLPGEMAAVCELDDNPEECRDDYSWALGVRGGSCRLTPNSPQCVEERRGRSRYVVGMLRAFDFASSWNAPTGWISAIIMRYGNLEEKCDLWTRETSIDHDTWMYHSRIRTRAMACACTTHTAWPYTMAGRVINYVNSAILTVSDVGGQVGGVVARLCAVLVFLVMLMCAYSTGRYALMCHVAAITITSGMVVVGHFCLSILCVVVGLHMVGSYDVVMTRFFRTEDYITMSPPRGYKLKFQHAKYAKLVSEGHGHPYLNVMRSSKRASIVKMVAEWCKRNHVKAIRNLWGVNEDLNSWSVLEGIIWSSLQVISGYNTARGGIATWVKSNPVLLNTVKQDSMSTQAAAFVYDTAWYLTSDELTTVFATHAMVVMNLKANAGSTGRWNQVEMYSAEDWQRKLDEAIAVAKAGLAEGREVDYKGITANIKKERAEHEANCRESIIDCDGNTRFIESIKDGDKYRHGHYMMPTADCFTVRMNDGKVYLATKLKVAMDADTDLERRLLQDLRENEHDYVFTPNRNVLCADYTAKRLFGVNDPTTAAQKALSVGKSGGFEVVLHRESGLFSHMMVPSQEGGTVRLEDELMVKVQNASTNVRAHKNKSVLLSFFDDQNCVPFMREVLCEATMVYHAHNSVADAIVVAPGWYGVVKHWVHRWIAGTWRNITAFTYRDVDVTVDTACLNESAFGRGKVVRAAVMHISPPAGGATVQPDVHGPAGELASDEGEAGGDNRIPITDGESAAGADTLGDRIARTLEANQGVRQPPERAVQDNARARRAAIRTGDRSGAGRISAGGKGKGKGAGARVPGSGSGIAQAAGSTSNIIQESGQVDGGDVLGEGCPSTGLAGQEAARDEASVGNDETQSVAEQSAARAEAPVEMDVEVREAGANPIGQPGAGVQLGPPTCR